MEINSTSGFLNDITNLNKELRLEAEKSLMVEVVRDIISSIVETATDSASHEEDTAKCHRALRMIITFLMMSRRGDQVIHLENRLMKIMR